MDLVNSNCKDKILVAGDVKGKLSVLYKKVNDIQKKFGLFDLLICVGDFFGDSCSEWHLYKNRQVDVPIATYILGPTGSKQLSYYANKQGCEIVPNIHFLGSYGVLTTVKGSRIAYLSGMEKKSSEFSFTSENLLKLKELCRKGQEKYHGVDVLMTNQWPLDITEFDRNAQHTPTEASEMLCWIVNEAMPRYHFAGNEGASYERPPFTHIDGRNKVIATTRFIGLANVGNPEKKRWIYALSLKPLKHLSDLETCPQSLDKTPIPFKQLDRIRCKFEKNHQYFFQVSGQKREHISKQETSKRFKAHNKDTHSGCWFCLSDPNVERHLIISIGKHSYLALAKGGLVEEHLIISSIGHYSCMSVLPESARIEIFHYKEVLKKYFSKKNKVAIFYERNFKTFHLQIQVVPLAVPWADSLKSVYLEAAGAQNMKFDEYAKGTRSYLLTPKDSQYFHIELPDGTELLHTISGNFPIHFGRDVLVQQKLLNMADKGDWHNCLSTKEEETASVQLFKKLFAPYDFTIN